MLPDELLSMILETAYCSYRGEPRASDFAITISHISQRFRTVALNTPLLWSTLSNSQSIPEINTFIRRSKAVDMSILIHEGGAHFPHAWLSPLPIDKFMDAVIHLAPRWVEFRAHLSSLHESELDDLRAISDRNLDFPRLKRLSVACKASAEDDSDETTPEEAFFSSWRMPQLSEYFSMNILPIRLTPISLGLTTCALCLCTSQPYDWDFLALLTALSGFPCLRELQLTFQDVGLHEAILELPLTTLGALEMLKITVSCSSKILVIRSFIHSLNLPYLKALDYSLAFTKSNIVSFLRSIFPTRQNCPELQSVCIDGDAKQVERSAFETIFRSFPQIQALRIAVPTFASNYNTILDPPSIPPLRILVLKDCNLLSAQAFRQIIQALYDGPSWKELKKIEINSCLYLSAAALPGATRSLVGKKIIFRHEQTH